MASAGRLDGLDAALLERLAIFTRNALLDERRGMPSIKFVTVKNARLDKLLAQILDLAKDKNASPTALDVITQANELQLEWYRRFNVDYFSIDKTRMAELEDCGAKREVVFIPPAESGMRVSTSWKPCEDGVNRDIEGSGFQVGQYVFFFFCVSEFSYPEANDPVCNRWWLDISCAHRDGVVGADEERPTKGKYGNTVLPLLTGKEVILGNGLVKYTREGQPRDIWYSLLAQLGKPMRILRGFRLHSCYAPEGGVRYDGM